jgi:hypothetical protein
VKSQARCKYTTVFSIIVHFFYFYLISIPKYHNNQGISILQNVQKNQKVLQKPVKFPEKKMFLFNDDP